MSDASAQSIPGDDHPVRAVGRGYDPLAPLYNDDPYLFYARARRESPVSYSPTYNVWLITGHAEVLEVLRLPSVFSSAQNLALPYAPPLEVQAILDEGYPPAPGLFNNDPPGHTHARVLFAGAFTARRIAELEPRIRDLAHRLVDGFARDGQADLVERFAFPLPMTVIADLLGVPREDMPKVKAWHNDWLSLFVPGAPLARHMEAARSAVAYQRYYAALIEERRARPRDDLITALAEATVEGARFSMAEMLSHMMILLSAGHETATDLIGHMVMHLLQHPELWRAIDADPGLMGPAIEESVRFHAPVQAEPRVTTEEVVLGGVTIPRGARVHVVFASANRDPGVFPDPDRFDIQREHPTRHLGFGHGIHFCIGAPLARLETRVALEVLRERLPGLRIRPGFAPEHVPDFYLRRLKHLHLEWALPGAGA